MPEINTILGISNLACALLAAGLSTPLALGRVKMNDVYGVRFAKAKESPENWDKLNRLGGKHMLLWSGIVAIAGTTCFFLPPLDQALAVGFGLAPCLLAVGCLQTYFHSCRL